VLAAVYATTERWAELDAVLADAEKQIPDNLGPYLRASSALLQAGKTQDPEPNSNSLGVGHWRLGLTLEKQGRRPEAVAELQTAIRLEPKFEPAQKDLKRLKAGS